MEYNKFFRTLYNMGESLIKAVGSVWNWLSSPIKVDIPFLSDIPLIGPWLFEFELNYSPIELLGVGIGLLLILWLVKNLIPLG